MTEASGDRLLLSYVVEATYGLFPAGPSPVLQDIRFTSEGLAQTHNSVQSTQIDADRMVSDLKRVGLGVEGSIGYELSFGSHEDFMAAAIGSSGFSTPASAPSGTFSTTASTSVVTGTGVGTGLIVGDWVNLTGFSALIDATPRKVTVQAANEITVQPGLEEDITGDADEVVTPMAQIVNGTALTTFSFEKEFQDLGLFTQYTGCGIDSWSLSAELEAIITGEFGIMGKDETTSGATGNSGTNLGVTTSDVMASVDEITAVVFGPRNSATFDGMDAVGFSFETSNNLRARLVLGTLGPKSLGLGKFNATGTLVAYFESNELVDNFLNFVDGNEVAFIVRDSSGNTYVFDFPRIKFSASPRNVGGENQDVMVEMAWTAVRDQTEGIAMRMSKSA